MNLQFLDMVIGIIWIEECRFPRSNLIYMDRSFSNYWYCSLYLFFFFLKDFPVSLSLQRIDFKASTVTHDKQLYKMIENLIRKIRQENFSLRCMYFQVQNEINLLLGEYDSVQKQVGKSNKTMHEATGVILMR